MAVKVLLDREALLEGSLALSPALLRSLQEEVGACRAGGEGGLAWH